MTAAAELLVVFSHERPSRLLPARLVRRDERRGARQHLRAARRRPGAADPRHRLTRDLVKRRRRAGRPRDRGLPGPAQVLGRGGGSRPSTTPSATPGSPASRSGRHCGTSRCTRCGSATGGMREPHWHPGDGRARLRRRGPRADEHPRPRRQRRHLLPGARRRLLRPPRLPPPDRGGRRRGDPLLHLLRPADPRRHRLPRLRLGLLPPHPRRRSSTSPSPTSPNSPSPPSTR